jgi:uncharacterized protein YciW
LSTDPATGQLKPGTGAVFVSFAKQLAERPGQAGANAYLHLANAGLPVADLGLKAQKNAGNVLKQLAARGADVGKLPKVSVLEPSERDAIRATLKKKGVDPGPDASDADVLAAIQKHKPRLSDIVLNAPSSAGKALLGLPMGAWMLGQGAGALAFNHDPAALKQMGQGTLDYYQHIRRHPLGALEQDPVGTVMAVMPAKTLIGGAAGNVSRAGIVGAAAKDFATAPRKPLVLPKARLSHDPLEAPQVVSTLDQSPLSTNLIDRAVQTGASRVTAGSAKLSRKRIETISRRHAAESKFAGYQTRNEALQPVQVAGRKLSKHEKRAAVALAQGVTPKQMAAYYKIKAAAEPGSKHLKAQADIWDTVASKVPASNARIDSYLEALRPAVGIREASLQRITTADETMLQAREGIVQSEVQQTLRDAGSSLAEEAAPAPIYFPHVAEGPKFGDFLSHKSMQPILKTQRTVSHQNNLVLFREGRWQPDLRHVEARIAAAPLAEESLNHLQGQVEQFGRRVPAGTQYDPNHATLIRLHPQKISSLKTDVSGEGLAQQIRDVKATSRSNPDFLQQLEDQLVIHTADGVVPPGVDAVLVPNEVMGQIKGTLKSMQRGGLKRGANTATDVWRYITLNLRGGYLTNNIFGNTLQSGIAGVGPRSIIHAMDRRLEGTVPQKLIGSGTTADLSKVQRLGGNAETPAGRVLTAIGESAPARAIGTAMEHNPITTLNIDYENMLRRAVYLRAAVPIAKKTVTGSRFSRMSDEVIQHLEQHEVPEATQKVVDFLGDMRKQARHENLRIVMPFYRWIGFISKLSLATLPLKYPVRNALLQELGRAGNRQLSAMGIVPSWLQGNIPLDAKTDQHGHVISNVLSTQGLNPFASIAQTYGRGLPGLANSLNPVLTSASDTAYGKSLDTGFAMRDAKGNVIDISRAGDPVFWRTLIAQELRNLPIVNLVSPPQHHPADTIPIPGLDGTGTTPKGMQQPRMSTLRNTLAYLTGIRARPTDLTLYNLQGAYNLIQASNLSKEEKKAARHRFNVEMGKAKAKGGGGGFDASTATTPTYAPGTGYTTPTYSVP